MVRHCSYCKQSGHNRNNCSVLLDDVQRLYNEKIIEYNQLPLNRRSVTIAPTRFECKTILLENRKAERLQEARLERQRVRMEQRQIILENNRRRYQRAREQREIMRNLVITSVQNHLTNIDPNASVNTINTLQDYLHYGDFRNEMSSALLRFSSNNVEKVKSVETPIETNECPICFEDFTTTNKIITSCGHQYHSTCLFKHLQRNNNCPCCRGVLL